MSLLGSKSCKSTPGSLQGQLQGCICTIWARSPSLTAHHSSLQLACFSAKLKALALAVSSTCKAPQLPWPSPPTMTESLTIFCSNATFSLIYYILIVCIFALEYKFLESKDAVLAPVFPEPGPVPSAQWVSGECLGGEWINETCIEILPDARYCAKCIASLNVHRWIPRRQRSAAG